MNWHDIICIEKPPKIKQRQQNSSFPNKVTQLTSDEAYYQQLPVMLAREKIRNSKKLYIFLKLNILKHKITLLIARSIIIVQELRPLLLQHTVSLFFILLIHL